MNTTHPVLRGVALVMLLAACAPDFVAPRGADGGNGDAAPVTDKASTRDAPAATDVANDLATAMDAGGDVYVDVPVVVDPDAPPPPMDVVTPVDVASDRADAGGDAPTTAPDGAPLPNLIPVISNPQIQERTFAGSSCEVMEGCTVAGNRRLLRFDLSTPNIGAGDLYLGAPTMAGRPSSMFEYGTCHNHWHLRGYADYRLVDAMGREAGRGHKQSFCLLDSGRYMGMGVDLPATERYNCGNQGIHSGWMDIYGRGLDCQYIDITGVPPGRYRIRAQINVERVVTESNYVDNESFYAIDIPPDGTSDAGVDGGVTVDPTLACSAATEGLRRDCGWQQEGPARMCTPGARVTVGCNQGCMPPLGLCAGDPMIRICPGNLPCPDLTAISANDDSCPGDGGPTRLCSLTEFTCPSSGRYTILTGAFRAGGAYECHLEVR